MPNTPTRRLAILSFLLVFAGSGSILRSASATVVPGSDPRRPVVITVDDLPIVSAKLHPDPAERERITREMLLALRKHGIRAVGLVTWDRVQGEKDVELLRMWLEQGHELGNHSYKHLSYTRTAPAEYIADVEAGRKQVAALLEPSGRTVRFFRFPFLREGDTPEKLDAMRAYLAQSGQRNLPVTLDNQDWSFEEPWVEARKKGDRQAMDRVAEQYHESLHLEIRGHEAVGDRLFGRQTPQILLLHATEVSAAQWDRLFTWLTETGHRFAGSDEVLGDPAFSEPHRYVGHFGPGLWDRIAAERRTKTDVAEVEALLKKQAEAWSRGDLEAFTSVYADDATFLTSSGVTQGRQAVLDRYRKRYPDRQAMGTLTLEVLETRPASGTEVTMLGGARPSRVHGVSVAARWKLSYPEGGERKDAEGLTLIVLRRGANGWEIVQDASM
ncbi:MAG TPA: SgcJ/EcaC family oxidoreductase [Thermoanaerobaculia bacterium]|nr:SgcJ/EcaC family oxidoreductase [Thermoanaerobaculia bacterium]